jgi:hypothetical protein
MQLVPTRSSPSKSGGRSSASPYWLDTEGLVAEGGADPPAIADSRWYFVATTRPRDPERVARGLELGPEMSPEDLAETAQAALEEVANEVLADGEEE